MEQKKIGNYKNDMAGVVGFEPTHDGVRVRCLTAWLHPSGRVLIRSREVVKVNFSYPAIVTRCEIFTGFILESI